MRNSLRRTLPCAATEEAYRAKLAAGEPEKTVVIEPAPISLDVTTINLKMISSDIFFYLKHEAEQVRTHHDAHLRQCDSPLGACD